MENRTPATEELEAAPQETDDWDANGRYPRPIPQSTVDYGEQCSSYVQPEDDAFVPLDDGEPFCGEAVS